MAPSLLANFRTAKSKATAFMNGLTEIFIKETGTRTSYLVTVLIFGLTEGLVGVSGKTTR